MARQIIATNVTVHKRWFFWPAVIVLASLFKLGLLRDPSKAGKWIADHAVRIDR